MIELQYSPANLEDYLACPRRFQLRYMLAQPWPAQVTRPERAFEDHLRQGAALHRLIQQDLLGMPRARLSKLAGEEPLQTWWSRYLEHRPVDLPSEQIAEIELSARLAGSRLVGTFDLLAFEPGVRFVIVDWKTERKLPPRERLASRMQTILYPYLLAQGGQIFNEGIPIDPAQIEMLYWFAEAPLEPQRFVYSEPLHAANETRLTELLNEITGRKEQSFPLTSDVRSCSFCNYRSLCKRGDQAGEFDHLESDIENFDPDFDLDFGSLSEIPF